MDCNIIRDLIPLYIDGCCSAESANLVKEHIENCSDCKQLIGDMTSLPDVAPPQNAPKAMRRINDWKESLLQSVLLFLSFAVITVGVALEASTPLGLMNGYWAFNIVIPATAFLLSLSNWYFVRLYKSRNKSSHHHGGQRSRGLFQFVPQIGLLDIHLAEGPVPPIGHPRQKAVVAV